MAYTSGGSGAVTEADAAAIVPRPQAAQVGLLCPLAREHHGTCPLSVWCGARPTVLIASADVLAAALWLCIRGGSHALAQQKQKRNR